MTGLLRKEMDFEVAFLRAGGLLLAGPDPTGNGGSFQDSETSAKLSCWWKRGSLRSKPFTLQQKTALSTSDSKIALELFLPANRPTSILIKGDPSKSINEIENVDTVFKAGIGYDSQKLIDSVRGQVGIR